VGENKDKGVKVWRKPRNGPVVLLLVVVESKLELGVYILVGL